jgi:hypothetical protein
LASKESRLEIGIQINDFKMLFFCLKINDFDKYSKMILILIEASIFFLPVGEVFHVQAFPLIEQLLVFQAN